MRPPEWASPYSPTLPHFHVAPSSPPSSCWRLRLPPELSFCRRLAPATVPSLPAPRTFLSMLALSPLPVMQFYVLYIDLSHGNNFLNSLRLYSIILLTPFLYRFLESSLSHSSLAPISLLLTRLLPRFPLLFLWPLVHCPAPLPLLPPALPRACHTLPVCSSSHSSFLAPSSVSGSHSDQYDGVYHP